MEIVRAHASDVRRQAVLSVLHKLMFMIVVRDPSLEFEIAKLYDLVIDWRIRRRRTKEHGLADMVQAFEPRVL